MGLKSGSIPNFINGVSQQAPYLRLASQADEQINCYPTVVDGLKKRPPTNHVARLMDDPAEDLFVHVINRDLDERYAVLAGNGWLRVFDLVTGVEKTVAHPDGWGYLNSTSASIAYRAVTVADYTFIVSTIVDVGINTGSKSPARDFEALVNVKQGNYGKTYNILINGVVKGTYSTPVGTTASDSTFLDTSYITGQLVADLAANSIVTGTGGWTVNQLDNVIHLSNASDFTIEVQDGFNGNAASVAKGTTQRFSDLPIKGPANFVVEVVGDNTNQFDNYWVTFDGLGTWRETVQPNTEWEIDKLSMPHVLIRESDGTFTFKAVDWDKRLVGDLTSSPWPSFVGHKISDVFFNRNRLGFLSEENTIYSGAGSFFNFFRQTITAVLDDDPIDVGANHTKVSLLRHAVPFRKNLVLFSDATQFSLETGVQNILTPKTVSISPTSEYPVARYFRPVQAGDSIFFAAEGESTRIYEYTIDPDTQQLAASEVTAHVPTYVATGVTRIAGCTKHSLLAITGVNDLQHLFIYQWVTNGRDRLQSAWHKWDLGTGAVILGHDFIESTLHLVTKRDGGIWLENMTVDPKLLDNYNLDRRVASSSLSAGSYDAGNNRTSYTLPYTVTSNVRAVSTETDGVCFDATLFDIDSFTGTTIRLKGDTSGCSIYFGFTYQSIYKFSPILPKKTGKSGEVVISDARLQLRYLSLAYGFNTAEWVFQVIPEGRDLKEYVIGGYISGLTSTDLPPLLNKSGAARIPIFTRADTVFLQLISNSHLSGSFISADWEGKLWLRAQPSN